MLWKNIDISILSFFAADDFSFLRFNAFFISVGSALRIYFELYGMMDVIIDLYSDILSLFIVVEELLST